MSRSTKLYIIALVLFALCGIGLITSAQELKVNPCEDYTCPEGTRCIIGETEPPQAICAPLTEAEEPKAIESVEQMIALDENIKPEDLGVKEPKILPGNPFYFFKDISRGLRSALTFDPVAKAELKLKFSNERMLEVKKLADSATEGTPAKPAVLEKALSDYEKEIEGLKNVSRQIQGSEENPKVDEFLNKFLDESFKQQKLFGKLEKDLPAETYAKVAEAREANTTGIAEIGLSLAQPEILGEKLDKVAEQGSGSSFKNFKNLEVLKEVEKKVPITAKETIIKAQENSLKRLQSDLTAMPQEEREKFNGYLESIGGNEVQHLQVLDELKAEVLPTTVRNEVEKATEKVIEKVDKRLNSYKEADLEEAKNKFLEPLISQAQLEDMRIVKELENNLSPELITAIAPVKEVLKTKVAEKITTTEGQKEILQKIENKFYDVKQLEALKEIESAIPTEQKQLYRELEEKTIKTMQQEIKKAETAGGEAKAVMVEKVAGDSPEHIKILEKAGLPSQIMPQITEQTVERVADKVNLIEQPARMEAMKGKIEIKEVKEKIQLYQPQMFKQVEQRIEEFKAIPAPATPLLPTTLPTGRQCEIMITCQEGYLPYDTGKRDAQGCPIRKCIDKNSAPLDLPVQPPEPQQPQGTELFPLPLNAIKEFIPPTIKQIEVEAVPATPEPMLGGDRDEHGCIGSAGYSWCESKQKCLRIWEEPCPSLATSPESPSEALPEKTPPVPPPPMVCAQVITPAIDPDGTCKQFPTPCDMPADWKKVNQCPEELYIPPQK